MKVIQVMPEFELAGAEIMCENLIYELIKLGHDVVAVSMYDYRSAITERLENAGVDVRYLSKKSGLDLSMIPKLRKLFKQTGAEVVHTHRYCAQYAIPAAILSGVKIRVHTLHSIAEKENRKGARKLNKFFFKRCHLVPVALSELVKDSVTKEYGISDEGVPVVYNGINLTKCKVKEDYSTTDNFKILHIGRFAEPKNHIGLIKAFHTFHDAHPDSELWLIGDGDTREEIEKYANNHALLSSVKFFGLQSNVYDFLHNADIFTLPSNYEGIPMTLIEAMGTGLPIVATAVGGVPDMLDESSAILTDVDVDQIARGFEAYYNDSALRERHGRTATQRSLEFSAAVMAKKYSQIYESARKGKK